MTPNDKKLRWKNFHQKFVKVKYLTAGHLLYLWQKKKATTKGLEPQSRNVNVTSISKIDIT